MNDAVSNGQNEKVERIDAGVSSESNETKHCDSNDTECTFEIVENSKSIEKEQRDFNARSDKIGEKIFGNGEIVVTSILDCGEHERLEGVKINLYKINGLSPVLIKSEITDDEGKVIFSGIDEGCYRVIEIVDKKYFEKPKYINWNEIIIDGNNTKQKIMVVNKIKGFATQNKHKHF